MRKGWTTVKIDDVCDTYSGGTPSRDRPVYYGGNIPWVKSGEVENRNITKTEETISVEGLKNSSAKIVPAGSVLVAMYGANAGQIGKLEIEAATNQAVLALIPKKQLLQEDYLFYISSFITNSLLRKTQGSGQPNLNAKSIRQQKISLPPLIEQKKISAILRTWDEGIEKQSRIVAGLQEKRKALLGKLLLKQKSNKPLKYFLTPITREVGKPTSSYHALGLRSHCKGTFQRFIKDASTVAMETLYQVKENDLIVNITFAWEGAIALVKKTDEHCLVSHRFPTYEIDTSKALPQFVRHVVQTRKFIESLGIISPGGAGRNRVLNKKDFLELKIWLPDLTTQAHIADIVSTIELEIEIAESLLAKFKDQKRGLMQKLLTGEWPVRIEKEAA